MIRLTVRDKDIVQTLRIDVDKAFVGRSPSNTVVLKDAAASRKHCLLRVSGAEVEILDLNSRHGLKINGEPASRAFLSIGDRVEIGCAEIRLDEIEVDEASLARFGGYLDDDAHLYTMRDAVGGGTATATAARPAAGAVTEPAGASGTTSPESDEAVRSAPTSSSTFADDLYKVLRRTPAWGLSAVLHAALILALFQVPWAARPEEDTLDSFATGLKDGSDLLDGLEENDLDTPVPPDVADEMDWPDEPEIDDTDPETATEEAAPEPEPVPLPIIAPSPDDLKVRVSGLGMKTDVKIGTNQTFGKKGSDDANRRASGFVLESLGGRGSRLARLLRRRPAREAIAIRGTYDRVETVLDLFHVPHTLIDLRELRDLDLKDVRSIFINCSNEVFPEDVAKKVGKFVHDGGYVFSTDWALDNVITKAFPRTVRPIRTRGEQIKGTPDMVVKVTSNLKRHFFLQGTGLGNDEAQWWLEDSSYPIRVVRNDLVEVLVDSPELKKRYGSGAVAVTFKWGQGRVVHVMGHYFQKEGNLRGTFAMQKIITNFLVASIRKR